MAFENTNVSAQHYSYSAAIATANCPSQQTTDFAALKATLGPAHKTTDRATEPAAPCKAQCPAISRSYGPAIQTARRPAHLATDDSDRTANQTAHKSNWAAFAPADISTQCVHIAAHSSHLHTNC